MESPGKNTGVGSYCILHGIFPTYWWNLGVLLWYRSFTNDFTREDHNIYIHLKHCFSALLYQSTAFQKLFVVNSFFSHLCGYTHFTHGGGSFVIGIPFWITHIRIAFVCLLSWYLMDMWNIYNCKSRYIKRHVKKKIVHSSFLLHLYSFHSWF